MAHVTIRDPDVELDEPTLVEGLPGVGLVGKIATDHLVDTLDMTYYASVDECEGLPRIAMYGEGDYEVRPPVRVYADEQRDLLALQSDVPVDQEAASEFATCITDWLNERDVTPIYLSGLPTEEKATPPELFGIACGDGADLLEEIEVDRPPEAGVVSGPTGALLSRAAQRNRNAVGFVVQSNARFPDPEAARILLKDGVGPIADLDVPLDDLVDQADQIRDAKEQLAEQMQQAAEEKSTQAKPLRMYQ
ncbi:3-isopropylmalate dehydratase [Halobacteriales archaeon QS_1_68_20]|nr:MAG: 3-isopropylmalate dehydratase [Halobacteriales archaeon QS_1_68_20]